MSNSFPIETKDCFIISHAIAHQDKRFNSNNHMVRQRAKCKESAGRLLSVNLTIIFTSIIALSSLLMISASSQEHQEVDQRVNLTTADDLAKSVLDETTTHIDDNPIPARADPLAIEEQTQANSNQSNDQQEDENPSVSINTLEIKHQVVNPKIRRHVDAQIKTADWWTRISKTKEVQKDQSNQRGKDTNTKSVGVNLFAVNEVNEKTAQKKRPFASKKSGQKSGESSNWNQVYKEQPLNQNEILTMKNQLKAIRGKQKLLVTRSVNQLYQLDNRLIESYKLCQKKRMPLYAGMLYRTRDFVIRMGRDVKHERKVLDAMANQVQGLLRQRMNNKTLVVQYNKLIAPTSEFSSENPEVTKIISTPSAQKSKKDTRDRQYLANIESSNSLLDMEREQSSLEQSTNETDTQVKSIFGSQIKANEDNLSQQREQSDATTKKPKLIRYNVNVNEVNLRRELTKTQSLIDRINGSCHDLTGVIDDILYLFNLTTAQPSKKGGKSNKLGKILSQINTSQSVRSMNQMNAKKLLRSPIKVFFERYGKLTKELIPTSGTTTSKPSTTLTTISYPVDRVSAPDLKPIFEPSSLRYIEPDDRDLGFDSPSDEMVAD